MRGCIVRTTAEVKCAPDDVHEFCTRAIYVVAVVGGYVGGGWGRTRGARTDEIGVAEGWCV